MNREDARKLVEAAYNLGYGHALIGVDKSLGLGGLLAKIDLIEHLPTGELEEVAKTGVIPDKYLS